MLKHNRRQERPQRQVKRHLVLNIKVLQGTCQHLPMLLAVRLADILVNKVVQVVDGEQRVEDHVMLRAPDRFQNDLTV